MVVILKCGRLVMVSVGAGLKVIIITFHYNSKVKWYKPWPFATIFIQEKKSLLSHIHIHKDPLGTWTWERCCMENGDRVRENNRTKIATESNINEHSFTTITIVISWHDGHRRHTIQTGLSLYGQVVWVVCVYGNVSYSDGWASDKIGRLRIFYNCHPTREKAMDRMRTTMITELFLTHSPGVC